MVRFFSQCIHRADVPGGLAFTPRPRSTVEGMTTSEPQPQPNPNELLETLIAEDGSAPEDLLALLNAFLNAPIHIPSKTGEISTWEDITPLWMNDDEIDFLVIAASEESLSHLTEHAGHSVAMFGADLVRDLTPDVGLHIEGKSQGFRVSPEHVQMMRQSVLEFEAQQQAQAESGE